jgi:predicted DNA binding CopG/RHH family protein
MKSTKKNKKIKYGSVEAPEGFDNPKNHKIRITMWMDGDVLQELKKRAAEVGAGYQTYAQKILRDAVLEKESLEKRLERLEKALKIKAG